MLTNLVISVVSMLVTNVTEVPSDFTGHEPIPCPEGRMGCLVNHTKGVDPQAKLVTTEIKQVTVYSLPINGKMVEFSRDDHVISSKTDHFTKVWSLDLNYPTTFPTNIVITNIFWTNMSNVITVPWPLNVPLSGQQRSTNGLLGQ